jgi:hypothetical protein
MCLRTRNTIRKDTKMNIKNPPTTEPIIICSLGKREVTLYVGEGVGGIWGIGSEGGGECVSIGTVVGELVERVAQ